MKRQVRHIPVLLRTVLEVLSPQPGQLVVDCTLGLGGHSAELLRRLTPGGRLIAIDFDAANIERARPRLAAIGGDFALHHGNFAGIQKVLASEGAGAEAVDGLLADLGVASPQIDDPARGFSYRANGPLDMRMDRSRGRPASELVNTLPERQLAQALLELGDETDAPAIARLIVRYRQQAPIVTTQRLMEIVCEARDFTVERAAGAKLHPAARTFQALRILTNREMGNLENLLRVLPRCLKPGGVACIMSFHSGEDRRVKDAFRTGLRAGVYSEVGPEALLADAQELRENPRSRSAKLRWARRPH